MNSCVVDPTYQNIETWANQVVCVVMSSTSTYSLVRGDTYETHPPGENTSFRKSPPLTSSTCSSARRNSLVHASRTVVVVVSLFDIRAR